ncbi:hypothetical protein A3C87_03785 [Candidatus Kaiserbacteria bacterium RIFCSPHIGHO2_02_FULL_49_34]|uniref:GNAT family N-acetyltransferase n=1 Tax=Candidatus Kaiserbacteria bacterium RIFCSPHIGHO2_02_FULL_49_34 TaxID=1798491 RepID=A0A1F6DIQ5_9BACT|nr:MAG: hypothetical protein A3C87_03785 [Candidatus Kaiserbacteria bacterium RIFCSPHIGHO2_02_FULL_49_34]
MQHVIIAEPDSPWYEDALVFIRTLYVKKHNCHLVAQPDVIHILYEGDTLLGTMGLAHNSTTNYAFEYCDPPDVASRFLRGTSRQHLAEFTRYTLGECATKEIVFTRSITLLRSLIGDARERGVTHLGFMGKLSLLRLYAALEIPTEIFGVPTFSPPAEGERFGTYAQQKGMHVFGAYL